MAFIYRHRDETVEAVALFSVLMHARENNKFEEAAQAQRRLEELGVVMRFRKPRLLNTGGKK